VEAVSFAVWALRNGVLTKGRLSDAGLAEAFAAASASAPGLSNGARYAFEGHLKPADLSGLRRISCGRGRPVVESPALNSGASAFVALVVEGATGLPASAWNLPLREVALEDATRIGFTPADVEGSFPPAAFFRLKLLLNE
jgi:hypothetical protein